jgi:hypothetical protein
LWVDALCILQGSNKEAKDDWIRESAKMESVYRKASVTISAASASSSDEGFLHPNFCLLPCSPTHSSNGVKYLMVTIPRLIRQRREEPINSRCWTLQERLLSKNVLTFGLQELSSSTDAAMFALRDTDSEKGNINRPRTLRWELVVMDYCARNLTVSNDKLIAIGGLAKYYNQLTGDTYLCGLWKNSLVRDLLWIRGHFLGSIIPRPTVGKPSTYRAPSWSWASIDGAVSYVMGKGVKLQNSCVELLRYDIQLKDENNPYGMVLDGELVFRGKLMMLHVSAPENSKWLKQMYFDEPETFLRLRKERKPLMFLLLIKEQGHGLLLESVAYEREIYQRVGAAILPDNITFEGKECDVILK